MSANCWEYKSCGREPGGSNAGKLGVCPASIEEKVDGINNGINGGRSCWALACTLCGDEVQGAFAKKIFTCMQCDFYRKVLREEIDNDFKSPVDILKILNQ